jgi:hypothetical protein
MTDMQKIGAVIWKPTLVPFVEMKVEKDGKVLTHIKKLCESFNRNFFNILTILHGRSAGSGGTFGSGYLNTKTYGGSVLTTFGDSRMATGSGDDNFGILLGTKILNGSTAGKLAYQLQAEPTHTWTVGTLTWEIDHVRVFNNNSGGLITINEVCLMYFINMYNPNYFMVLRDLLAVGVDVPDAAQLTVTYHLQMVYPE